MAKITGLTTVPGSIRQGSRKVTYTFIKDDGTRSVLTQDVSGDRNRVRSQLATFHNIPEENISFDPHYDD